MDIEKKKIIQFFITLDFFRYPHAYRVYTFFGYGDWISLI